MLGPISDYIDQLQRGARISDALDRSSIEDLSAVRAALRVEYDAEIEKIVFAAREQAHGKRGMSRDDFLEWVRSVHEHQSFLQRNRSVLLRVVEQPDGRRGDSSGDYLRQVDCGSDSGRREVL